MLLLLVRHGQSAGNLEQRFQISETPLTLRGRQESLVTAAALGRWGSVDRLYTSCLVRAMETAGIIGDEFGLEPVPMSGLVEIDTGRAAGMLRTSWQAAHPELARILSHPNRGIESMGTWDGGESGHQFRDRVLGDYRTIISKHGDSNEVVVVVTHGGPLAWIRAEVSGDPLDQWPSPRGNFRNCSISELWIDAGREIRTVRWNQVQHLETLN
jgi:broad specificity phosphatase PhoE